MDGRKDIWVLRADRARGGDRCELPPDNPAVAVERARRIRIYVELRERGERLCVDVDEDLRRSGD